MLYLFDDFRLDKQEFSLERNGRRLPLEPRALSVLLVLVENHGRLLEKRALLDAVWKQTFVEETTLTRAIAVIRKTLDDSPRNPRYIETVPTRGYRFIAPVEVRNASWLAELPAAPSPSQDDTSLEIARTPGLPVGATFPVPPRTSSRVMYTAIAACVCAASAIAIVRHRAHAISTLTPKDTIVLADFNNRSGDPVFDDALRQGMLVQLEQSPVLKIASEAQIRKTVRLMNLPPEARVTAEVGREVCQRIGGAVVLDGSISTLGASYVIALRGRRCSTGEELAAEQVQIRRKEDAINAVTQIATRFRTRLGEAGGTVKDLDTPLAEATTTSLDALRAFSQGIRTFNTKGSRAALPLFQHAVATDPQFATAHVWLGRMYADLGEDRLAMESTQRAFDLRDHASERERFSIDVSYDLLVTGNLEKARAACDAWIQMYPLDVYPRGFLAAIIYPAYGRHDRALEEARASVRIDPDFVVGYRNAAVNLIALNRPDEAEQVLADAGKRNLYLASFVTDEYRIAYLRGDVLGMQRAAAAAPTNPWLLFYQSETLAQQGRLVQARVLRQQALHLAREGHRQDMEATLLVSVALTDSLCGRGQDAVTQAHSALRLSPGRYVSYAAGMAFAMAGQTAEPTRIAAELERRFPEDTIVQSIYVPTIRAAVALANKQPQKALNFLAETDPLGQGILLYPAFLRGKAYLALRQGQLAAAELHTVTDRPGLVTNDPLLCMTQILLARANLLNGDIQSARRALDAVRERWHDADSDFPALRMVSTLSREIQRSH